MRGLVEYLRFHGLRHGSVISLAHYSTTVIDGFEITNLPAYLLERFGNSGLTQPRFAKPGLFVLQPESWLN